jgi:hypothetical protein
MAAVVHLTPDEFRRQFQSLIDDEPLSEVQPVV